MKRPFLFFSEGSIRD